MSQGYLETVNQRGDGTAILTQAKARVLAAAVLAACDGTDGLVDGVVGHPDACSVDPSVVQCAGDVDAAGSSCSPASTTAPADRAKTPSTG